mmetsp:Transcript_81149/g.225833  ORF Transcript_81149/g.225833 Transcript_81149/m.225833 type:complete len:283 (+) Transcript_81149:104-952(+)
MRSICACTQVAWPCYGRRNSRGVDPRPPAKPRSGCPGMGSTSSGVPARSSGCGPVVICTSVGSTASSGTCGTFSRSTRGCSRRRMLPPQTSTSWITVSRTCTQDSEARACPTGRRCRRPTRPTWRRWSAGSCSAWRAGPITWRWFRRSTWAGRTSPRRLRLLSTGRCFPSTAPPTGSARTMCTQSATSFCPQDSARRRGRGGRRWVAWIGSRRTPCSQCPAVTPGTLSGQPPTTGPCLRSSPDRSTVAHAGSSSSCMALDGCRPLWRSSCRHRVTAAPESGS